jgi:hypothetical protein
MRPDLQPGFTIPAMEWLLDSAGEKASLRKSVKMI